MSHRFRSCERYSRNSDQLLFFRFQGQVIFQILSLAERKGRNCICLDTEMEFECWDPEKGPASRRPGQHCTILYRINGTNRVNVRLFH